MTLTGEAEKICIKCPWSDKRSLPYVLYCPRFDVCTKRPKQTRQEQKKSESDISKIQAYILTRVNSKRRQTTVLYSEAEALGKGLSEKLLEAAAELWKVGKISRYKVVEGGVWIWIGI